SPGAGAPGAVGRLRLLVLGRPRDPDVHLLGGAVAVPVRPRRRGRPRAAPARTGAGAGRHDPPGGAPGGGRARPSPARGHARPRPPRPPVARRAPLYRLVRRPVGALVRLAVVVLRPPTAQHLLREGGRTGEPRLRRGDARGRAALRVAVRAPVGAARRLAAGGRRAAGRAAARPALPVRLGGGAPGRRVPRLHRSG